MPRILIIDDDLFARKSLRAMLSTCSGIAIVGEAGTLKTARELLAKQSYDLVFLDIQLLDGNGFDLVPHVRFGAHVIFVSGHAEHALRAFAVNALDYLEKPVEKQRLDESLRRYAERTALPARREPNRSRTLSFLSNDVVRLDSGAHARFSPIADISVIESQENYSLVRLSDGTSVLVRRSLKAWEKLLPRLHFMRVHRLAIVNYSRIVSYERNAAQSVLLAVAGVSDPIHVSRRLWADLKQRLDAKFPSTKPPMR